MTLAEFLLARIAEDEARLGQYMRGEATELSLGVALHRVIGLPGSDELAARVLRECEAKRRIVESTRFSDNPKSAVDFWLDEPDHRDLNPGAVITALTNVLKSLAAVYSDHPDYQEDWRP